MDQRRAPDNKQVRSLVLAHVHPLDSRILIHSLDAELIFVPGIASVPVAKDVVISADPAEFGENIVAGGAGEGRQDSSTPTGPAGQLIGIRLPEYTIGVNWYLADQMRLMFNYTYALPDEPNTGTSVANIFSTRLGVFW